MTLTEGARFGPYVVTGPLGRGGMATVYKCHEPGLDRYVAVKVLPREFLHEEAFAERFRQEARVIARLEHPNIVPIHAFGIEDGIPWMAMRFVPGGSLSGLLKKRRLDVRQAVGVLRGVAESLDYAHSQGIVHRDVKPQNILLDDAGRVYLADFGIAKIVEGSPGLTRTGMISGTPQYMAPEQAMAAKAVDHRVDIYALGVVAYELLTGQAPFSADTPVGVLLKQVSEPVPRPSAFDVPEAAGDALLKCLAKDPAERWPSATAFVAALEQGLLTVPTLALPATLPAAAPRVPPTAAEARAVAPTKASAPPPPRIPPLPSSPAKAPARNPALIVGAVGTAILLVLGVAAWVLLRGTAPSLGLAEAPQPASPPPIVSAPSGGIPVPTPEALAPAAPAASRAPAAVLAPVPAILPPAATLPPSGAVAPPTTVPVPLAPAPSPPGIPGTIELDVAPGVSIPVGAQSGAVTASTLRWQVKEGRSGRFKRLIKNNGDVVTIKGTFDLVRGPKSGDWTATLSVDLLDEAGKVVTALGGRFDIEDDRTSVNLEQELTKEEWSRVKKARIRFQATKE